MSENNVIVCGLPQSGKTSFLAALWHLVTMRDLPTRYRFRSLQGIDASYLNEVATRWREAKRQPRTVFSARQMAKMCLKDEAGQDFDVIFPDFSGEVYSRIWEARECDYEVVNLLRSSTGVLLFVHSDTIRYPRWIVDDMALVAQMGGEVEAEGDGSEPADWEARTTPTQVQLVEILQMLRSTPLDIGPRRVVIVLSAWDLVEPEGISPESFMASRLPLLQQYLSHSPDQWEWTIRGISAQGGEFEPEAESDIPWSDEEKKKITELRKRDASSRIRIVDSVATSHDITEPLAWLRR